MKTAFIDTALVSLAVTSVTSAAFGAQVKRGIATKFQLHFRPTPLNIPGDKKREVDTQVPVKANGLHLGGT